MIRLLFITILAVSIYSCNSNQSTTNATLATADQQSIIQQEITQWQLAKLKNMGNFQNNLASDYLGYFGTHTLDRFATVEAFKKSVVYSYRLSDIHTKNLDGNAAVVYYILDRNIIDTTIDAPWTPRVAASAIYVKQNGKWLSSYYQEMRMPVDQE